MKYKLLDDRGEVIEVYIENAVDILIAYLLLKNYRAKLITNIDWQYKLSSEAGRRAKRIYVRATIDPLKLALDKDLNSLRVTGRIIASEIEEGILGRTIGVDIKIGGHVVFLCQNDCIKLISHLKQKSSIEFVVIAIDDHIGSIVLVKDRIIEVSNKAFHGGKLYNQNIMDKFDEIKQFVVDGLNFAASKSVPCILAYPHSLRRTLKDVISMYKGKIKVFQVTSDVGGYEGVINVLKSKEIMKYIGYNRVSFEFSLYYDIARLIDQKKIIYGMDVIPAYIFAKKLKLLLTTADYVVDNLDNVLPYIEKCVELGIDIEIIRGASPLGYLVRKFGGMLGIT